MFYLVNKAKKNNKGFSLVELIVVVLIIAIIAVALAPQVMKYVGKAKTNTSENTAATIKSSVQAAIAEYEGDGGTLADASYTVDDTDSAIGGTETNAAPTGGKALQALIHENVGSDKLDKDYTITIKDGTVTVS